MEAVTNQKGGVYFLYGYGGTGKTFMWSTLAAALRSKRSIVLTVASSGIASLLLPGGRTAHSKFKIPIPILEKDICKIDKGSDLAELLKLTQLIIWDEAPMAHKFCFEALDTSLKDIMSIDGVPSKEIFGGKVIVFGGDFRQILPVIPRGTRSDIVHATLNASYIWDHCTVFKLTRNMRLENQQTSENSEEVKQFSDWILKVGDGKIAEPNDGIAEIPIPSELLLSDFNDPIDAIVNSTYPNLLNNFKNADYLRSRAILASTIEVVNEINDYVLNLIPGEEMEYLSSYSIDRTEANDNDIFEQLTPKFLHSLHTSGLPNHAIKLKIGTPIMLLRNLDQFEGLCNGTRLSITRLADHVIEAKIITGKNIGNLIYIPRMPMSPSQSPWPFKLLRKQFPIMVSFAMTINKSQGQSLDYVGLYLPREVFSHGQLYVALFRVKTKQGLKILIHDKSKAPLNDTTNVVFKEVFQNIL
ncbi:ATP-dependent DNA helicase PIF1 [Trifolium pratense]|uniref:ATP-dependent DNA helicase n=2 Tax=Trifolium pratense TaxID=57577 RepID=A0A2K3NJY4_TRIPR|nr:ATP-dependent DNA helicase PIF1 [Trifolium pratense]